MKVGMSPGDPRRRSGVLKLGIIVVPPWDSPATDPGAPEIGGMPGTRVLSSLSLLSSWGVIGRVTAISALLAAYSAASELVINLLKALS
jgi:hypothetical protein